jgi:hypothetical protein
MRNSNKWHFNKQVNLSVVIQIILLASLILGSWMNLQRQLDMLQKDVAGLIERQKNYEQFFNKTGEVENRLKNAEDLILKLILKSK